MGRVPPSIEPIAEAMKRKLSAATITSGFVELTALPTLRASSSVSSLRVGDDRVCECVQKARALVR